MSLLENIRSKFRHHLVLLWLTDRLVSWGFTFKLSYWIREIVGDTLPVGLKEEDYDDFTFVELGYNDMEKVARDGEHSNLSLDYLQQTISKPGVKCFALKHRDQIACMTWFNFTECDCRFLQRPLKDKEVYCFEMFTMKSYRGRNLAPYLRFKAMNAVKALGAETFYSVSDYFNPPAIRFKKKMNAEFLELHLLIALLSVVRFSCRLK
jgi:hypothetical protein